MQKIVIELEELEARELLRLVANPPMSGPMLQLEQGIKTMHSIMDKIKIGIVAYETAMQVIAKQEAAKAKIEPSSQPAEPAQPAAPSRRKHPKK